MTARRALVLGSGEVGSAVAHALRVAGHPVVLHDIPRPAHARRAMAFADAFFDGKAALAGVEARHVGGLPSEWPGQPSAWIAATDAPLDEVIASLQPQVLVDARMRKHDEQAVWIGRVVFSVGIGPGFVAGTNVDVAVESAWGPDLGRVIRLGPTAAQAGEPRALVGLSRERFALAPKPGVFVTPMQPGQAVKQGEMVGKVSGHPVLAPVSGTMRGLVHDGAAVPAGARLVEVIPPGSDAAWSGIGERPAIIAASVREVVMAHEGAHG